MSKSVIVKSYLNHFEEYKAAGAITPGMLVELTSAGTVQRHSGAGKTAFPMFAIEDALQGRDINYAYIAGDIVRCWIPTSGDTVNAYLADEEVVVIGTLVESNGLGALRKESRAGESWESADTAPGGGQHSLYDRNLVGLALEAKDLSSLSTAESTTFSDSQNNHTQIRIF